MMWSSLFFVCTNKHFRCKINLSLFSVNPNPQIIEATELSSSFTAPQNKKVVYSFSKKTIREEGEEEREEERE
jgi:hypothetical protein